MKIAQAALCCLFFSLVFMNAAARELLTDQVVLHYSQWDDSRSAMHLVSRPVSKEALEHVFGLAAVREFQEQPGEGQSLVLVKLPDVPEIAGLELEVGSFWSGLWLARWLAFRSKSRVQVSANASVNGFVSVLLPGSLSIDSSCLKMSSGQCLMLTSEGSLPRLPDFFLNNPEMPLVIVEIPGTAFKKQKQREKNHASPVVFPGLPDGDDVSLLSAMGIGNDNDTPFKRPPFGEANLLEGLIISLSRALGHARTIYGEDGEAQPRLRLTLQQGVLAEARDGAGRVLLRYFLSDSEVPQFWQGFQQTLRFNDPGSASGNLFMVKGGELYGERAVQLFQFLIRMDTEYARGNTLILDQLLRECPTGKGAGVSPPAQNPSAASGVSREHRESKSLSSLSTSHPSQKKGDDNEPEKLLHIHLAQGRCCPACNNKPCHCPECRQEADYDIDQLFELLEDEIISYDILGLVLGLSYDELKEATFVSEEEVNERALWQLLSDAEHLTVRSFLKVIQNLLGSDTPFESYIKSLADELGLREDAAIKDENLREIYDGFKLILQKHSLFEVSRKLGFSHDDTQIARHDAYYGFSAKAAMTHVLRQVASTQLQQKDLIKVATLIDESAGVALTQWFEKDGKSWPSISETQLESLLQILKSLWISTYRFQGLLNTPEHLNTENNGFKPPSYASFMRRVLEKGHNLITRQKLLEFCYLAQNAALADRLAKQFGIPPNEISMEEYWARLLAPANNDPQAAWRFAAGLRVMPAFSLALNQWAGLLKQSEAVTALLKAIHTGDYNPQRLAWLYTRSRDRQPDFGTQNLSPFDPEDTQSQILQPRHFLSLVAAEDNLEIALAAAIVLKVDTTIYEKPSVYERQELSFQIWNTINLSYPFLQIGHLRQIFEALPAFVHAVQHLPSSGAISVSLQGLSYGTYYRLEVLQKLGSDHGFFGFLQSQLFRSGRSFDSLRLKGVVPRYLDAGKISQELVLLSHFSDGHINKQLYSWVEHYFTSALNPDQATAKPAEPVLSRRPAPDEFICPITLELMDDPVATFLDQNRIRHFSKEALLRALSVKAEHPMTRKPLTREAIERRPIDMAHKKRIQAYREAHE